MIQYGVSFFPLGGLTTVGKGRTRHPGLTGYVCRADRATLSRWRTERWSCRCENAGRLTPTALNQLEGSSVGKSGCADRSGSLASFCGSNACASAARGRRGRRRLGGLHDWVTVLLFPRRLHERERNRGTGARFASGPPRPSRLRQRTPGRMPVATRASTLASEAGGAISTATTSGPLQAGSRAAPARSGRATEIPQRGGGR